MDGRIGIRTGKKERDAMPFEQHLDCHRTCTVVGLIRRTTDPAREELKTTKKKESSQNAQFVRMLKYSAAVILARKDRQLIRIECLESGAVDEQKRFVHHIH